MSEAHAGDDCPVVGPTTTTSENPNMDQNLNQVPSQEELLAHVRAQPGTALVKERYIDFTRVSERYRNKNEKQSTDKPTQEKRKESESEQPQTKKQRGQNKNRPRDRKVKPHAERPCLDFLKGATCRFGDTCKFSHDISKMMEGKSPDIGSSCIHFDRYGTCPFGLLCRYGGAHIDRNLKSVVDEEKVKETGGKFVVQNVLGKDLQIKLRKRKVPFKKADRYLKALEAQKKQAKKISKGICNGTTEKDLACAPSCTNLIDTQNISDVKQKTDGESNSLGDATVSDALQPNRTVTDEQKSKEGIKLEEYDAVKPSVGMATDDNLQHSENLPKVEIKDTKSDAKDAVNTSVGMTTNDSLQNSELLANAVVQDIKVDAKDKVPVTANDTLQHVGTITDADVIKLRPEEKVKLDVKDKLLLAPLTTVGNLPFRAVCKKLGADITCGEMAMCTNLLQGQTSEWALLKRHPSEDVFGVQLCGAFPDTMTKCAELLNDQLDIDFIDINGGCPIDLVYHKGAGSGLMNRMGRFQEIVQGMSTVLDVPLTVKMRTGVHSDRLIAHKIIPQVYEWGASVVTVHGRTREQRYSRLADWDYLRNCVKAAKPYPFVGNGDILSFEDANFFREQSGAAGQMIARGALIKPWIFTEIKEQRHWDISSKERFDIMQDYVNLGLLHWGSDSEGVRKTRRFLLEWLSFLHRYIPVGLLERLPQRINERPPYFVGRDDLETLMASANCADWVKISEMFLGPVPDDFQFLPKHKANSYK